MKSVILASVLTLGSVGSVLVLGSQAAYAQELQQITGIQINPDGEGIQIEVQTASGSAPRFLPPSPNYRSVLVIDLLDAQLSGGSLSQANPAPGILSVNVDRRTENSVRLTIIGSEQLPVVNVQAGDPGVVVSLGSSVPVAAQPTPLPDAAPLPDPTPVASEPTPEPELPEFEVGEITVTADRPDTYNPSSATTATRTDTPLRDIPQSIQVVPRQVIEDRNARTVTEAVETVSGVNTSFATRNSIIRGFSQEPGGTTQLRNSYRTGEGYSLVQNEPAVTVEQVEALKGPTSVLFGALEPGGIINVITRQPLSEPSYNLALEAGNYGFYQPSIDLSGPLTADDTVLYRFIATYNSTDGYFNNGDRNNTLIAPSITLNLGDQTSLDLFYEYSRFAGNVFDLYTGQLSDGSLVDRDIYFRGNSDLTFIEEESHFYGFDLEHSFNENLQLRSAFSGRNFNVPEETFFNPTSITDDRFVDLQFIDRTDGSIDTYFG